jgi:thiol-disulfide isomerase/thioredoxin
VRTERLQLEMHLNTHNRKRWLRTSVAAIPVALAMAGFCRTGITAEPQRAGAPPAEIAKCYLQTGETAAELARKTEFCRQALSAEGLNYLQMKERERAEHPTLKIGAPLPEFALKGVDGKIHTRADYKASPVLVVMFIANHCPVAQLYESREKQLFKDYAAKGVAFVAIQSDGPKATPLGEMGESDVDDSFDGMVVRAAYRKFPFPYLYDGDEQAAANKFGPKVTPHIFIFDKDRKLRFGGRIDDNLRESHAKTHETRDAIEALLAGRPVPVEHTPVFGCSTSWNSNVDSVQRELNQWQAKPVTVETVTMEGLKNLRGNPTGKMLMINFWATWCGPCRTEYPELLRTYQWYQGRGFDFISVSVDNPDNRAGVLRFLQDVHSPIRNLQVDSEDVYAMKAFDPTWESGVPFTIVLAPDGKIVYRHEGAVDVLTLRRAILANLSDRGPFEGITDYWRTQP